MMKDLPMRAVRFGDAPPRTARARLRIGRSVTVSGIALALAIAPATAAAADSPGGSKPVVVAPIVDGYTGDQLANAQAIITAATRLHLDDAAAVLGVSAAIGESGLHNIAYGDGAINPDGSVADSIGLFQQQHWWGSTHDRMTPSIAATSFFIRLETIPDWESLTPTAAIHAVQGNADPDHYTPAYPAALDIVAYLQNHPLAQPAAPAPTAVAPLDLGSFTDVGDTIAAELAAGLGTLGGSAH
jgi:hypothetical protein